MTDSKSSSIFHYPENIELNSNPLVEAWLELQWELPQSDIPNVLIDKGYPFALGLFYSRIRNEYGYKEELDSAKAPEGLLPYIVQYRFRKEPKSYPLLQLGPGIATVNFVSPYTWELFKEKALYLRDNLINSYIESILTPKATVLRYRNVFPLSDDTDATQFLSSQLNVNLSLPKTIPGYIAKKKSATGVQLNIVYELQKPHGIGTIKLATAYERNPIKKVVDDKKVLLLELEINSSENNSLDFNDISIFENWLEVSHSVIHEWFFSFIDGNLFDSFMNKE